MLVTLEGIDGSGKSVACEALSETFQDALVTREPTHSWYGDAVRRSIDQSDADSLAELFLYTADHAAHLSETIQPALDSGQLVISDRYADSRYAYQGVTLADRLDDPMAFVRSIHEPWTRSPDLTLYLDVPARVGADRSGGTTKFERADYLTKVRENYERLIADDPDRFVRIDGTRPKNEVRTTVLETVEDHLNKL